MAEGGTAVSSGCASRLGGDRKGGCYCGNRYKSCCEEVVNMFHGSEV
jgi:hypothetical protein